MAKGIRTSVGIVKRHPDGFGFFIPDSLEESDVYIPRQEMRGVMTNDRVKINVYREKGGDRFRGEIVEILQRAFTRVMGQYHELAPGQGLLLDKSFAWGENLHVRVPKGMTAKNGDLVVARIENYPDSSEGFRGEVISIIGDAEDPINDSIRVLHLHNIPFEFSRKALEEADRLPDDVDPEKYKHRKDLRSLPIITIDGQTAKDFDDAVFTEVTQKGFHLIVAIADVSHYLREGTALDEEAYLRGTSTYFPSFVAPMLPEKLSNELCSLKPGVARLALVADMLIDFQGELVSSQFYEAIIQSHARVTYGQAQEIIDGVDIRELAGVKKNILQCADLAKLLMAKRFREGSLDLDLPETEIELDEGGVPVDIMRSERLFSHRLIEELMLMANVAVARFFSEREIPTLYRVHDRPEMEAIRALEAFLKAFGYKHRLSGGHLQKKISRALEHFSGHPKEHILNVLALRSLAQAQYSPNNIGHFGLGFRDYLHFTSPIRRYPDLIVHRQLKAALSLSKGYSLASHDELETAGTVLSACEQRSVKAERQIHAIKKARFLSRFIGEEFEGIISSVTKFGLFVMLRQFDVDGLLRVENLGGDRFEFDEEKLRLVGKRSGMCYEIGDPIRVLVARVDTEVGQIDFLLPEVAGYVEKAQETFAQRRPAKNDSRSSRRSRIPRPRRSR